MTDLNQNQKLKEMLSRWGDISPRPGFESRVWRRIHTAEPSPAERMADAFRGWLVAQPALAHAATLAVGVALGLAVITSSVHPPKAHASSSMNILRTGSVAGSYLQLVSGEGHR